MVSFSEYYLTNLDTQLSKNSEPFFAVRPPSS
jgi:hypothetical protein